MRRSVIIRECLVRAGGKAVGAILIQGEAEEVWSRGRCERQTGITSSDWERETPDTGEAVALGEEESGGIKDRKQHELRADKIKNCLY